MKKVIIVKLWIIVPAVLIYLTGCQTTSGNLYSDLNTFAVNLHVNDYSPKIDAAKYHQFSGKKMCMSNIRNDARDTSNFGYYSKDLKVQYLLSNKANTPIQFVQSFFWYAYQKSFMQAGLDTSADCSAENTPELWIIFQSLNDEELQLKITILKNRVTLYEKDLFVQAPPATSRDIRELQKRAYDMIDLTVTKILDDPGFQQVIMK